MRNILIKIRSWTKFISLVSLATFLILGIVLFLYKPAYKVMLNGELIGYCTKKSKLQGKIDEFIENGDGKNNNVAFVSIDNMPEYSFCMLKKDANINEEEILEKITAQGVPYYKYYAIIEDTEEKIYVSNISEAEEIVNELKEKDSENIEKIAIIEKYETELKEFSNKETAISSLYKEKKEEPEVVKVATNSSSSTTKSFSTSSNISKSKVSLGISLIKPITGKITSRFGVRSSLRSGAHTGLDIGAASGTPIKAAASGTITHAGYKGAYGNLVVITHSNGTQTYYGHCSKLYVSNGQKVSQGQTIAAVGSTGNSTGPHLHFEIRVNGVAYNPQSYVY